MFFNDILPRRAALKAAGNPDYTTQALPNINQLFQSVEPGAVNQPVKIKETIAPSVLKLLSDWIKQHTENAK